MSSEQISDIIQSTAEEQEANGVPFTNRQLHDCTAAFVRLQDLTHDPVMTLAIFDELVARSLTSEDAWDWVAAELRFEAHVAALGNRTEAALSCLRYRHHLSDELLDCYNERIQRFARFTTLTH